MYREKKTSNIRELVGGDPNKIVPIREYIVFERIISFVDGNNKRNPEVKSYGNWRVAGKLEYKKKDASSKSNTEVRSSQPAKQ